jgi:hypothetical protein
VNRWGSKTTATAEHVTSIWQQRGVTHQTYQHLAFT